MKSALAFIDVLCKKMLGFDLIALLAVHSAVSLSPTLQIGQPDFLLEMVQGLNQKKIIISTVVDFLCVREKACVRVFLYT